MVEAARSKVSTNRRLDRACKHVSDLWFPASQALIDKIRQGLQSGNYDRDLDALYFDLKADFSLFIYSLKELSLMLQKEQGSVAGIVPTTPHELVRWAGVKRMHQVLQQTETAMSAHSIDLLSPLQRERFEEAVLSAATAEALSEPSGVDPELGFSTAMLRQLGLTLIAFNYSSVYEETMAELKAGESLDLAIAARIGFTPSLLAASLLQRWGVSSALCSLVDKEADARYSEDTEVADRNSAKSFNADRIRAVGATLEKICSVGEALARANNPERYPDAAFDWSMAQSEIEYQLGTRGMNIIRKKLKDNVKLIIKNVPTLFKGGIILDPEIQIARHWDDEHLKKNPFIASCRKGLKKEMHQLYEKMCHGAISKDCLATIVKDLIPLSGFKGGIMYTIDPTVKSLIPQLKIGDPKTRKSGSVSYGDQRDVVARAYESFDPIIDTTQIKEDKSITSVSGVIGFSQRIGVLFLEIDHARFSESGADYVGQFRALSKALSDALSLN